MPDNIPGTLPQFTAYGRAAPRAINRIHPCKVYGDGLAAILSVSPRTRRLLGHVARFAVTGAALAWLLTHTEGARIWRAMATAPVWVTLTPFALLVLTAVFQSARWTLLLRAVDAPVSFVAATSIFLRAAFIGAFSPRGGADIARIAYFTGATGRVEPVLAVAVVSRILDVLPWFSMLLWGITSGALDATPPLLTSARAFSALFAILLAAAIALYTWGEPLALRLPLFRDRAVAVARATRSVGKHPRAVLGSLGFAVLIGGANVTSVAVIVFHYGATAHIFDIIGIVPAMDSVISLPVTISGVGLREGAFILAFSPHGLDTDTAVAAAWIRWSGELLRALLGGMLFLIGGRLHEHSAPGAQRDPSPARHPEDE